MNPIQPIGPQNAHGSPVQAVPAAKGAGATSSATSVAAVSSSISVTMVQTQVDAMLESVGGGLQNNELLRMVIALLIMQALFAQDGGDRQMALDGLLQALGQGGGRSSQSLGIHTATNVVQIQQQSTVLTTSQAALAPTDTGGQDSSGQHLDLSA